MKKVINFFIPPLEKVEPKSIQPFPPLEKVEPKSIQPCIKVLLYFFLKVDLEKVEPNQSNLV